MLNGSQKRSSGSHCFRPDVLWVRFSYSAVQNRKPHTEYDVQRKDPMQLISLHVKPAFKRAEYKAIAPAHCSPVFK